jgi:Copper transport outer membrane protein, MctB
VIDFRYHLVSIVAVFLALAIGIVLGATALQGGTLDALKFTNDSLQNQLNATTADRDNWRTAANAADSFVQLAQPKLVKDMLDGDNLVLVTEPGAPSGVISGIQTVAKDAGATVTGMVALQPKFNDLSGASRSTLYQINSQLATSYGIALAPGADSQTAYQQDAAQVIAEAILQPIADAAGGLSASDAQTLLKSYVAGGYLTYTGSPFGTATSAAGITTGRATLAVIVTPQATTSDGPNDPADEVLIALATQFATASAATLVAGPVMSSSVSASPITVLRSSSVSGQVSSVDNADTPTGQVVAIWALSNQLQGAKPGSYGISSGASTVSPVPSPVPSVTPTPTTSSTPTSGTTGKVKKTVRTK